MTENQVPVIRHRFCDTREPFIIQEKLIELGWERATLSYGDYMFRTHDFKAVGITRKTVSDFLNSISSNTEGKRFGEHLEEMLDYFELKIILLEGSWEQVKASGKIITARGLEYSTWDMTWDYLRTWQDRGFTLELTSNEGHTIRRLNRLYAYYQKPYHTGGTPFRSVGDDRVMAFPPGTRGKTALNVLKELDTLQNVANAGIYELTGIEGIGQKKATAIFNHFHEQTNQKKEVKVEAETTENIEQRRLV